jgi:hypothetical protein
MLILAQTQTHQNIPQIPAANCSKVKPNVCKLLTMSQSLIIDKYRKRQNPEMLFPNSNVLGLFCYPNFL